MFFYAIIITDFVSEGIYGKGKINTSSRNSLKRN